MRTKTAITVILTILFAGFAFAQDEHAQHMDLKQNMAVEGMYGKYPLTREASGTSWQPESTPHAGIHLMREEWMLMLHGFANLIYDHQGGRRSDTELFSSSMFMAMAKRPLAGGTFGLRSMLSLDPLMGKRGYALLLQTGETADGTSGLIDRQHPHDLFMELAGTYSLPLSDRSSVFTYLGLPGEPALGPPAFMHRFSGIDFPSAPISHHWLDSTHITYGVVTIGYVLDNLKLEASRFRGREPDQSRFDIEAPELDSYSGRLTFNPYLNWSIQASFGAIDSPEQLHPEVDTRRFTASITYNKPFADNNWQTTLAFGRNDNRPGKELNAFLLESTINLKKAHTFFSRFERVEKDELFSEEEELAESVFKVNKVSCGYIYDLPAWKNMQWGIGGLVDFNILPKELHASYGDDPVSYMLFIRVKLE